MARSSVTIQAHDGRCECSVFRPDAGTGPWPAVLVFMDGVGIRPALFEIGERIAAEGHVVLLPDLFYRAGPYVAPDPAQLFGNPGNPGNPELRAVWMAKYLPSAKVANVMADMPAFLDFLAAHPDVKQSKVGTTGYCMGGGLSLSAAGHFPDRVAAAASFHGGRLATDTPESPHLLAPRMRARLHVAGAMDDPSFPDDMKQRLVDALCAASVVHTVVTERARHGWVPRDTPVHDPDATERHYRALFALFSETLGA